MYNVQYNFFFFLTFKPNTANIYEIDFKIRKKKKNIMFGNSFTQQKKKTNKNK